jgi:hypothetical protein
MLELKNTDSGTVIYFSNIEALRKCLNGHVDTTDEICRGIVAGNWSLVAQHLMTTRPEEMPTIKAAVREALQATYAAYPTLLEIVEKVETTSLERFRTDLCIVCATCFKNFKHT